MNMKLKQCQANRHVLRSASAIVLVLIILLVMSLPVLASAAYGGVTSQSDSFYVADEADVISSDTEKYIIEKSTPNRIFRKDLWLAEKRVSNNIRRLNNSIINFNITFNSIVFI